MSAVALLFAVVALLVALHTARRVQREVAALRESIRQRDATLSRLANTIEELYLKTNGEP